eukprot:TRINITY_DN2555_c0_g1_i2.p1 TRINITY_DN2555_c0_g1~~TRINITY_DN2555_c0_g1_i2.p1  ORF type:complete len:105 (-),score=10.06 TRINITY_DN2555_c0_g1_i2:405-719(-)
MAMLMKGWTGDEVDQAACAQLEHPQEIHSVEILGLDGQLYPMRHSNEVHLSRAHLITKALNESKIKKIKLQTEDSYSIRCQDVRASESLRTSSDSESARSYSET